MKSKLRKKILDKLASDLLIKTAQEQVEITDPDYADKIMLILLDNIKIKGLED